MRHTTLTPACVLCVLVIFVGTLSGATGRLKEAVFTVNNVDRLDGVDPGHHSYRMLEGATATFNCTATGYRHGDTLTISVGAGDNLNVTKTHKYTRDILNVTESQTVTYTIHNVTCADMGTYTCTVGHTGQMSDDINIHLLIWHCPPQLCRDQHHQQTITAELYRPADVSFCVVTHPVHTPYPLLLIGDTTLTPGEDDPLYSFNWTHLGVLYHTVQLHIKNVTQFQYLSLVLFTSERKVLAHRIKVRPAYIQVDIFSTNTIIWATIGGGVIIVAILVITVYFKRRGTSCDTMYIEPTNSDKTPSDTNVGESHSYIDVVEDREFDENPYDEIVTSSSETSAVIEDNRNSYIDVIDAYDNPNNIYDYVDITISEVNMYEGTFYITPDDASGLSTTTI